MRLPGHSRSHTPRVGASAGLPQRDPSALPSLNSESESDMVGGSGAALAARESAGRTSGMGRSGASAAGAVGRDSRDGSQMLDASMSSREASGLAVELSGEDDGDSGRFDGTDDAGQAAPATEDGRQRAARCGSYLAPDTPLPCWTDEEKTLDFFTACLLVVLLQVGGVDVGCCGGLGNLWSRFSVYAA